jgi:hypothetical protein
VARFGAQFDAQGVLAGSPQAARCIGYLTKYLTPGRAIRADRIQRVIPRQESRSALFRSAQPGQTEARAWPQGMSTLVPSAVS